MADKRLLITGASSGVGRSLTHYFAPSFEIIAVARRLAAMKEEFHQYETVLPYEADLTRPDKLAELLERVQADRGAITHVINNAGVNRRSMVTDLAPSTLEESIQVNALSPLTIMQAVLPTMVSRDFGRIVNVTSGAPLNCFPGFASYSGSKALLNAITVTAARELEDRDIKINLMSPGPVHSEMSPQSTIDPEVCHPTANYLVNLNSDGPTGRMFWLGYEVPLFPDLAGVDWLAGDAGGKLQKVF